MIKMSSPRSESVSNGRFVGAASIVPTGAAAVTPLLINVNSCGASSARLCASSTSTVWEKTSERSLVRVAAVVKVLFPLTPIAAVAAAVGKAAESGVPLLAFPEAREDALLFLFLSFAVACLIGTVGSVIDAVREVFQAPQEPAAVRNAAAAAAVVRPSTDSFSISHKMALKNDDGEDAAPPASSQDSKAVHHEQDKKKKKRVTFGVVRIQEHDVILGTGNTLGESAHPLTLDWAHAEETVTDLDAHEELMSKKKRDFAHPMSRAPFLKPDKRQERILEVSGVPLNVLFVAEWRRLQQEKKQKYEDSLLPDEDDDEEEEAPAVGDADEPVADEADEPLAATDYEEDEDFPQEFEDDLQSQVDPEEENVDPEEHDPEDQDVDDESTVAVPIQKKRVTFGPVLVQEYKVILGTGVIKEDVECPLTLDWAHTEATAYDLEWWEEGQNKGECRFLEPEERRQRIQDLREQVELVALDWKEEFKQHQEKQQALRLDLGELLEEEEGPEDDQEEVARPVCQSTKKKRSVKPTTQPLRRSARLAAKPRINYKE